MKKGKRVAVPVLDTKVHLDECEWSPSLSCGFTLPKTELRIVKPMV